MKVCHCEERSDEAICSIFIKLEIASPAARIRNDVLLLRYLGIALLVSCPVNIFTKYFLLLSEVFFYLAERLVVYCEGEEHLR